MKRSKLDKLSVGWGARAWGHARAGLALGRLAIARGGEGAAAGEALRAELDQMKGLAMKIGQIVSYLDAPVPEELRSALAVLQTGATSLAWDGLRPTLEAELGAPVDELFERFDLEPIAAASIGQVHRARHRGREVAVKVRYPGVRETFQGDTRALHRIAGLASLASAVDGNAIVGELAARLEEECDYRREAEAQALFRRAFAGDPAVVIPEVVGERSTEGVITTTFVEGETFAAFAARASERERNQAAHTLMRFALTSLFRVGAIQADPHPGNTIFLGGERVAFLDFGCVRHFEPELLANLRALIRCIVEGRRGDFDELVVASGFAPRPDRFDFDHHWRAERATYAPFLADRFRFTPGFVREATAFHGPKSPNARTQGVPPAWIWILRLLFGLYSILGRLEAEGRFGALLEAALGTGRTVGDARDARAVAG